MIAKNCIGIKAIIMVMCWYFSVCLGKISQSLIISPLR